LVRQKDTIENVEFTHIISYKTSLLRSNKLSAKSTFLNSTSRSYALALYELGEDNDEISKIENEMESLKKLIIESSEFKEMISSPTLAMEDKKNVMFAIANQNNFSQTLKKFLGLITIKNRLFFLRNIIENFLGLVSNNKGELKAKLVSSKKLSNDEKKKIENELSQDLKSPLKINYEYDPDLIAGLVIQVGSVMIDTSIKTKLKKIEKSMIGA
jgi:F-type H+-transporting ATPase subunit delta